MKCNLQAVLDLRGVSQTEISKRTGIGRTTISRMCRGKMQRVDADVVATLCKELKCQVSDIFLD